MYLQKTSQLIKMNIDDTVTINKNLIVASDISMGGRLFLGSEVSKISVFDLSINDDASVKRNLHVDGTLVVGNYPDETILKVQLLVV